MAKGISLHLGLNAVDPGHYMGWDGELVACENDAHSMEALAQTLGYAQTKVLLTDDATSRRVTSAIKSAASSLESGDAFFLTYSGHGGQVLDTNGDEAVRDYGEIGETADTKDETWCLFDRQLVDDELWALWSLFPRGVRIFVLSDSCHSGTATREVPDWDDLLEGKVAFRLSRGMPKRVAERVQAGRAATYARIQKSVPPREDSKVEATVALVSGCMDNQTSLDGDINGLFTQNLLVVWDDGRFEGSLHDLRDVVANRMPPSQTPNYYTVGRRNTRALARPALRI
jgi:hypothetical protein